MQKTAYFFLLFILFSFSKNGLAQSVKISGKIFDSIQQPVPNVNIIATPQNEALSVEFSISSQEGEYQMKLEKDENYLMEITHLGFQQIRDSINLTEDTVKDYQLKKSVSSLEEVLIEQKMAVVVKEDTIVYRTDQFKTGDERKLKDILEKLPGVEVDREGNVKVKGKPVTKLLVDGKTFFTGDEKLGVKNIPSDAVDEIEAIDDYQEVSFLKGLKGSDKMALNIKLKEGKKKFVFGDVKAGGGHEERYIVNPTLFYYSPKTSVNFIGDLNNIGERSFTFNDYMDFNGGFMAMTDNNSSMGNIFNDQFAQFLRNDDFVFNKNVFGAASLDQEVFKNTRFNAYSIVNQGKTRERSDALINYLSNDLADENRINQTNKESTFSINKMELKYDDQEKNDFRAITLIKTSDAVSRNRLNSQSSIGDQLIQQNNMPEEITINQDISANKMFSFKHTTTLNANYRYKKTDNAVDWEFNQPIFTDIIPFEEDGEFLNFLQNTSSESQLVRVDAKHYWVLNNTTHLYPKVGLQYYDADFSTLDRQLLNNGSINSFQNAGFNNQVNYQLMDYYAGVEFKKKLGDYLVKPGLVYHQYYWKLDQFDNRQKDDTKGVLTPTFTLENDNFFLGNLNVEYELNSRFSGAENLANRLRLTNFNSITQGNENLENELFHDASLRVTRFSMSKGRAYNFRFRYKHKFRDIQRSTDIQGINQVNTFFYSDLPENSYTTSGGYTKMMADWWLSGNLNVSLRDYKRLINERVEDYNNQNIRYTVSARSKYDNLPNIEFSFSQQFSSLVATNFENEFKSINPEIIIDYNFWEDFFFEFDYRFTYFENQTQNTINRFSMADAELAYQKEDSKWRFEIRSTNIFNNEFRQNNSFSSFTSTDRRIFIQPRIIMGSIIYDF